MYIFSPYRYCTYIGTSSGKGRSAGTKGWAEQWMEKRKVRWRLDGYLQTENMEEKPRVLASWRPPWKNGGMGTNRKTTVNDWKRGRGREEISKSLRQKKRTLIPERKTGEHNEEIFILHSHSGLLDHITRQAASTCAFFYTVICSIFCKNLHIYQQ